MSLLNQKAVRQYILNQIEVQRKGWECSRVSPKVLVYLEYKLQRYICDAIRRHPSRGKTFTELL